MADVAIMNEPMGGQMDDIEEADQGKVTFDYNAVKEKKIMERL